MMNPMQRHFEKHRAAKVARHTSPIERSDIGSVIGAAFQEDYRRIKSLESFERKAQVKREVLPRYTAYVDGIIEADQGAQDDIMMTLMLWRIDAADYGGAIDIARYALRHGLTMPQRFDRSVAALVAEEFADASSKPGNELPSPTLDELQAVAALVDGIDMHDQIAAKLAKEIGRLHADAGQFVHAREHLGRAVQLHAGGGAKSLLKSVEAAIARQPADTNNNAGSDTDGSGAPESTDTPAADG